MKLIDVLAFGAHQDDAELGVGGTLILMKEEGAHVGIVSLTRGEMNSRATPEIIGDEAKRASAVIGTEVRDVLDLGDCRIEDAVPNRLLLANIIRQYRPRIVLAPHWEDRHTDHVVTSKLVREAIVLAHLKKLDSQYGPHSPELILFYLLQVKKGAAPSLVVNTTDFFERKMKAVRCYSSQFEKTANEMGVLPIGVGDYLFHIESRDRYYGSLINVKYGEAFVSETPLGVDTLKRLIK